jgi:outer membrane protein assembly factor BamB
MSPDGSQVYVTGISAGRLTTVAYNTSTGGRVWATRVANSAAGDSLAVSPDGAEVVAAGRDIGASGYYDYLTVGYDALTGAKLWTQQYDGPGDHQDIATAVAYSPSTSAVYVTGYSDPAQSDLYDYATIAYSVPDPSWDARREVAQERGRRFPRAGALSEAKRRPSPAIPPNRPGSR